MDNKGTNELIYKDWLAKHVNYETFIEILGCYPVIESFGYKAKLLHKPLLETTELSTLLFINEKMLRYLVCRFMNRKKIKTIGLAMNLYMNYIKELHIADKNEKVNTEKQTVLATNNNKLSQPQTIQTESGSSKENSTSILNDFIGENITSEEVICETDMPIVNDDNCLFISNEMEKTNQSNNEYHNLGHIDNSREKYDTKQQIIKELVDDEKEREKQNVVILANKKKKTIREAIVEVLNGPDILLTADQIYSRIIESGLYMFKAKQPIYVVYAELRKACKGLLDNQNANVALFGSVKRDNTKKEFYLLSRESEMENYIKNTSYELNEQKSSDLNAEELFVKWLEAKKKLSVSKCNGYLTTLKSIEKYATKLGYTSLTLLSTDYSAVKFTVKELYSTNKFVNLNNRLHNLYGEAIDYYLEFVKTMNNNTTSSKDRDLQKKSIDKEAGKSKIQVDVIPYSEKRALNQILLMLKNN